MNVAVPDLRSVRDAVINIRRSKLPDPAQIGNSGSFFKNPIIGIEDFERLKERFSDIPGYPAGTGIIKVAAGWLIEKAGWKGYREGHVGVHDRQALVLVHFGKGQGNEILLLSDKIRKSVLEKFGITLVPEVNILP
jgi:UDP-N-acetylmuramate dehydrogenase